MNRYFFYMVIINSITSLIVFLPRILLNDRYHGALVAILFALPFGTMLLYLFSRAMMKFPERGIPEILKMTLPSWAQILIMLAFAPAWYLSGIAMLTALAEITQAFVNPDVPLNVLIGIFVILILFAIRTEGSTVLYSLEIFLIFIIPAFIFIFIKALIHPFFNWNACMEVVTHSIGLPTLKSVAVTTYVFTGYFDMITLNRAFKGKFSLKYLWLYPLIEFILMILVFLIPIGLLGTQGCSNFYYPWIITADSLSIKTGPIERALFIYILVFIVTSLVNIIVHWHVSLELFKGLFQYQLKFKKINSVTWWILLCFGIIPIIIERFMVEESTFVFAEVWLQIRLFIEPIFVGIVVFVALVAKKKGLIK